MHEITKYFLSFENQEQSPLPALAHIVAHIVAHGVIVMRLVATTAVATTAAATSSQRAAGEATATKLAANGLSRVRAVKMLAEDD